MRNGRFLFALFFLLVCFQFSPKASGTTVYHQKLPSGRIVKILNIDTVHFTPDGTALMLEYITDMALEDVDALRREAEEIWPVFRVNVEEADLTSAVIKASKPQGEKSGSLDRNDSYSFVIKKQRNGTWHFHSWGRDYEKEAQRIADAFLTNYQSHDFSRSVQCLHFPTHFTKEQLAGDLSSLTSALSIVHRRLGTVDTVANNDRPMEYRYVALQSASKEYWTKHPFFNRLVYDVTYSGGGQGVLVFKFSIIEEQLEINSVLFGLPADDPDAKALLHLIGDGIKKAFSG
jgi:hypothetical protein